MKCNKRVDYIISYFKVQNTYTLSICYKNRSDFATSLRKLVLLVSVALNPKNYLVSFLSDQRKQPPFPILRLLE